MYFLISDHSTNSLTMVPARVVARESSARADPRGIASSEKSCDHAQVSVVVRIFPQIRFTKIWVIHHFLIDGWSIVR